MTDRPTDWNITSLPASVARVIERLICRVFVKCCGFLKMLWFLWTLQVLLQRGCLTCYCVHSRTPKGNRERPESGIYFKIFEKKFNEHPITSNFFYTTCLWIIKKGQNMRMNFFFSYFSPRQYLATLFLDRIEKHKQWFSGCLMVPQGFYFSPPTHNSLFTNIYLIVFLAKVSFF